MPIRSAIRSLAILVLALPLTLSACTTSNVGDCQDACSHQTERTFCDVDGVYPGTLLENECIVPPSADACNRIESCPEGLLCTDDSMGLCVECLGAADCGGGQSCSDANTCVLDSCTPGNAGDDACLAANADTPRCAPDETCVECLLSSDCSGAGANASVCDEEDLTCRGCIANSECASKVCDLEAGVCASEDDIVHVAKTGADGSSCGTLASPCLTITAGLAQVTAERDVLLVGAGEYAEKVVMTNIAVSLIGDGAVNINPALGESETAVLVSGSSDVRFDGIDIALAAGGSGFPSALRCDSGGGSASLSFSRGTISRSESKGSGVRASDCTIAINDATISGNAIGISTLNGALSITRSTVKENGRGSAGANFSTGSGILIENSEFEIVNNFLISNGGSLSTIGGLSIVNSADVGTQVLDFNTIANNRAGSQTLPSVDTFTAK